MHKNATIVRIWVSRPKELPLQPLVDPYVNLSIHTAPIKQSSYLYLFANEEIMLDAFVELTLTCVQPLFSH